MTSNFWPRDSDLLSYTCMQVQVGYKGHVRQPLRQWAVQERVLRAGLAWRALVHAARQLLDAVLFGSDHIGHIQELASASWTGMIQEAEKGEAGEHTALLRAESALPALRAPRHGKYAALPFEVSALLSAMPAMPSTLWAHAFQSSDRQGSSHCVRLHTAVAALWRCALYALKRVPGHYQGMRISDSSEFNEWTGIDCLSSMWDGALLWRLSSCLVQIISNELDGMGAARLPGLLDSLPWLLLRFQAARKRVASSQAQSSGNASDKGAAGRMKHTAAWQTLHFLPSCCSRLCMVCNKTCRY